MTVSSLYLYENDFFLLLVTLLNKILDKPLILRAFTPLQEGLRHSFPARVRSPAAPAHRRAASLFAPEWGELFHMHLPRLSNRSCAHLRIRCHCTCRFPACCAFERKLVWVHMLRDLSRGRRRVG